VSNSKYNGQSREAAKASARPIVLRRTRGQFAWRATRARTENRSAHDNHDHNSAKSQGISFRVCYKLSPRPREEQVADRPVGADASGLAGNPRSFNKVKELLASWHLEMKSDRRPK
jgi:hypothetical protein